MVSMATVRKLGIDYAQGFHLGRPEPTQDEAATVRSPATANVPRASVDS
jgi:EAL domain-containing protein (putative c-di-GMP-specific phosphodiesterase class I)